MNKLIRTILLAAALCVAARAEQITVRMPNECVTLINSLAALDGTDKAVKDSQTGEEKALKIPYDFGKDAVRIRLAIRKNLIALRAAFDVYEVARRGYVKEVFGTEQMSEEEYKAQPEPKKIEFTKRASVLTEPVRLDLSPFTEADFATFAGAGVPGTVSAALDAFAVKPPAPTKK